VIVPLSNFVPRGFGFVHHSIAILYKEVPNPDLTIRNFSVAVGQPHHHATVLRLLDALAAAAAAPELHAALVQRGAVRVMATVRPHPGSLPCE
jgi:hypothetical protein